jgi:hypothetical protein
MMLPSYEEGVFVVTDRSAILTYFQETLPSFVQIYPYRGTLFQKETTTFFQRKKNFIWFLFIDLESEDFYKLTDKLSALMNFRQIYQIPLRWYKVIFYGEHIFQEKEFLREAIEQVLHTDIWYSLPAQRELMSYLQKEKKSFVTSIINSSVSSF